MSGIEKPTIVCVHLYDDFSGAPLMLSEVIEGLVDRGYSVELFTSKSYKKGFLSKVSGAKHYTIPFQWRKYKGLNLLFFALNQILLFFALLKYWRKDVLFYVNTLWPFGAGLCGRILNKKVVYHVHETSVKPKRLKRFLIWMLDYNASDVIYVSNYLKKKDPVKRTTPHVIYNTLAPDFTTQLIDRNIEDDFVVLMLCSLKAYKGIHEFVELAARLSDIKFELVVSAIDTEVNSYFKNVRFPNNMTLYPIQEDVHPFYARASLVVNLSHPDKWLETFGLTILEAMHYGVPAIVPPNGGISELVIDDYNGYKISVKELHKIVEKILELQGDTLLYNKLAANAKDMAIKYNYTRMMDSIESIITD